MRESAAAATARQRRVWEQAAPEYDRQLCFWERVWFGRDIRDWIGDRARGQVLEVAIGTGRDLDFYPTEASITGVDLSPAMLSLARARAISLGREVRLVEADAAALPFADSSFDTVVCALGLCSIPDPERAIIEMVRVLRTNGRLILVDHVRSTCPPLLALQWVVQQVTARLAGEFFTRRPLPLVQGLGLVVESTRRTKLGTVECVLALKRAAPPPGRNDANASFRT